MIFIITKIMENIYFLKKEINSLIDPIKLLMKIKKYKKFL